MEVLKAKIKNLEIEIKKEIDVDKQIEMSKTFYKAKLELLDKIHQRDKKRAGIEAIELIRLIENMPRVPKYATGIFKLDNAMNGGFETGLFINLAGESFSGKTTLLLSILANISESRKTVFFNFEMGNKLIVKKLKNMKLKENQLTNLIIDTTSTDIDDLLMEITLYAEDGVKFFAIDSKMKITSKSNDKEYQKISQISSRLARICYEKDIVIFLINQMSEDDIKSSRLAFKGSGDQKYDSDIALFLTVDKNNINMRKLICTKNRQEEKQFSLELTLNDYTNSGGEPEIVVFDTTYLQNMI